MGRPAKGKPTVSDHPDEFANSIHCYSHPIGGQRPVLGEFLLIPVSFHDALSISLVLRSTGRADGTPSEGQGCGERQTEWGWSGTS